MSGSTPVACNGVNSEVSAEQVSSKSNSDGCCTTPNGAIEYGQDQIIINFTDFTTGLLDITSEVEVGEEVEVNGCTDSTMPPLKAEETMLETEQAANVEPGQRSRATSEDTLYCFCRQPWDQNNVRFMIECTACKGWFHGSCVGVPESLGSTIESYHCKVCEPTVGPIIYKDPNEKPIKAGTKEFLKKLKGKVYLSADKVMMKLKGEDITINDFFKNGFAKPILVNDIAGLDIKLPKKDFTVRQVEAYVGSDFEVDVIDVERQTDIKMTMKEFCDYFTYPARNKLYNLISLEFSKTRLNYLVSAPGIVRKLDWVNSWKVNTEREPPSVSKYCLISTKESFTDFHIDFGGTSVWYHVLWGEKVFYLIEPTPTNLRLYERWMSSNNQNYETFLADIVDYCYQIVLKAGQTLFIPTGWIHAVLTTEDSLVFGGNFLHHLNIDLQLKVYEIEKALRVPSKYLFPHFENCTWYAAHDAVEVFEHINRQNQYPVHFIEGLRALGKVLRTWVGEDTVAREIVPKNVKPFKLIKRINRIVRQCDRRLKQSNTTEINPNRKGSLSGSLQSTSNPTSPASGSGSESDVLSKRKNLSSAKRKIRISESSASSTYEQNPPTPSAEEPLKPIKIKLCRRSVSDTSAHTSPDRTIQTSQDSRSGKISDPLPQDLDKFKLECGDTVQKDQFEYAVLPEENIAEVTVVPSFECSPPIDETKQTDNGFTDTAVCQHVQDENEEVIQPSIEHDDQSSVVPTTSPCDETLYAVEPQYYDEIGFGHYITKRVLVEIDDQQQTELSIMNDEITPHLPSSRYSRIEPVSTDENGFNHYVSRSKLGIDLRDGNTSIQELRSEGFKLAPLSTDLESSGEDDLRIVYESTTCSPESTEESRHRRRHKKSKRSKKSKSRDSSESRRRKEKKDKKRRRRGSNDRVERSSLNCALAGALDGIDTLLKDSNYTERLAESAQRPSTSDSMKTAYAEILENETMPMEKRLKRSKRKIVDPWAEENIQKVHQDDNYIYLPLAGGESSDEDFNPKRRKLSTKDKRKEKAEVWSPSVRVGQMTKREACPPRAKAKVLAVEKGLENAAAVLSQEERNRKSALKTIKKKSPELKIKVVKPRSSSNADAEWHLVSNQGSVNGKPSTSSQKSAPAATKPTKKGKKGLMTPKQRLGKILKLGKFR